LEEGKVVETRRVVGDDIFRVTTRVSIRSAVPDEPAPEPPDREPLVDVFDDSKGLRVVVELPGVKKEDVRAQFLDGTLRIEVTKGGRVHRKDIPWKAAPGTVEVKSRKENNSVVEMTFQKKPRGEKK
jgi:HSP20 family molecular chaperone IbpA